MPSSTTGSISIRWWNAIRAASPAISTSNRPLPRSTAPVGPANGRACEVNDTFVEILINAGGGDDRFDLSGLPAAGYPEFIAHYRRHFLAREDRMPLFGGMQDLLRRLSMSRRLAARPSSKRCALKYALARTS